MKKESGIKAAIQDPNGKFVGGSPLTKEDFEDMMSVLAGDKKFVELHDDEPEWKCEYTLAELQESTWYEERPECIRQAIDKIDPTRLLKMKSTGKQCYIHSFEEPESGKLEDVTVTVYKTGKGGAMELGFLDRNGVFGVKLDDLEPWEEVK